MKNNSVFGIPYWVGAVILGLLNTGLFFYSGEPWAITGTMSLWGAEILKLLGVVPEHWLYFREIEPLTRMGVLYGTLLNVGLVLGVFFAALRHREFRIRRPRRGKQLVAALLGGLLMGYGSRLAGGCSIGALVGGTASLSLHGWLFGLFLFPGAWLGLKLGERIFFKSL